MGSFPVSLKTLEDESKQKRRGFFPAVSVTPES
jgi:hypothetical protein